MSLSEWAGSVEKFVASAEKFVASVASKPRPDGRHKTVHRRVKPTSTELLVLPQAASHIARLSLVPSAFAATAFMQRGM